ncbi:unnamed protein product [Peronospora destructor]|uniref:Uncharacterized protein n=1 Tax=Peronospora destructor TaxID=86335 RepID=A0AAV0VA77_9STRA|nr:unnamed protein product [Peronospora destructor]
MAPTAETNAVATSASSVAIIASPSTSPHASSSSDASVSPDVLLTAKGPANSTDDLEITTAEFSINLTDSQTWAINFYECAAEGDLECLEEILDSGLVGVNDVDVDGFTALMVAAAEGHRSVVHALLRRGADVSLRTHELHSTALHFAAKNGDAEIVNALCEWDTKVVDYWNINADTPLIWACIEGRAEAVKVLLTHGADVNVMNQYGASTLLCAVMIGEDPEQDEGSDKQRAKVLTMLLDKNGKLVNFQDREGSSAMHMAASCGYLECVKTLLAFGAEITLRNVIGQTPLEEAQESELRESSPCVEHLRGIWRQLEEEAATRMMAMLEMEKESNKSASGGASGLTVAAISKKNKKKNKKAKRKAVAKQHQQLRQEDETNLTEMKDKVMDQKGNCDSNGKPTEPKRVFKESTAAIERDITAASDSGVKANDDKASSTSSDEDEDEDAPERDSFVSIGKDSDDDHEGHSLEDEVRQSTGTTDEKCTQQMDIEITPSTGAWTTVGKKHRSAIAAVTTTKVSTPISPLNEKTPLVTTPRRKIATTFPKTATAPHRSRRKLNQRPGNVQERSSISGNTSLASAASAIKQVGVAVADAPVRPQERRWGKTSGSFSESRSIPSSSLLSSNALAFGSHGLKTGLTVTSSVSSFGGISPSRLSISSASPWRPSFHGTSSAPYTAASSLSSSGLHYTSAGRLTWKQQRASGNCQVARETRDRWVSKLRLSNESVAETLSYLACGLCGELVSDNLQCSGDVSRNSDEKTSSACTQLYCASCLESSAYRAANSTLFKCIRCQEVISKDSMTCNSFAQAQAASLGLFMPNSASARTQDDATCYSLKTMQCMLEASDQRISGVDLHAFHLVPGSDLSTLSNGQLEVLETAHQRGLVQIVEQRLANARVLERLQMDEWLKMQRDVLQFAPR